MAERTIHVAKGKEARWDPEREEYDVRTNLDNGQGGYLVGMIRRGVRGPWAAFRYTEGDADRWSPRKFVGYYASPSGAAEALAR